MKVKNVLKGLRSRYDIKQINIIAGDRVIFSGKPDGWDMTSVDMILYKKEVENYEVVKSMVGGYCYGNAFLFVIDPHLYEKVFFPCDNEKQAGKPVESFFID